MTLVLGLDLGSTTTKAVLAEVGDALAIVHVAHRPTPRDPAALVSAAAEVAAECARHASAPVAAVGIASMAEGGAALDRAGRPLTPILRWDRRVDRRHLDALLARHPGLPHATGVPATTKPAAVVLTALRADEPAVFAALGHWAGAADLVAHALTGVRVTDHTLAARTMMAGRDGLHWDEEVLDGLGLSAETLPETRDVGEANGLTTAAARRFGLAPGIPVHVAGHDHVVGAWAAGARAPGTTADSLGTAEAIVRIADAADVSLAVDSGFAVGRTVDGTALTILGGSPACGGLLARWAAEHPEDDAVGVLEALAPGTWETAETLVLPYPSGRQCPAPDRDARLRILPAPPAGRGDAGDRVRGLLQSLVLHARWMRETADSFAGSATTEVTVLGSLAERIPVWAPLSAAASTAADAGAVGAALAPTLRCTAPEPVAAGAALLAGVREGVLDDDVRLDHEVVVPARSTGLHRAYRRFVTAALADGTTAALADGTTATLADGTTGGSAHDGAPDTEEGAP